MKISVWGGTGYSGGHVARVAAERGHEVTAFARTAPSDAPSDAPAHATGGVAYEVGTVLDAADRARSLDGADAVVVALSPRGDMADRMREAVTALAEDARRVGVRFGIVGGAGSLLVAEDGPRFVDTEAFAPEEAKPEALTVGAVLDDLRATPDDLDWFMVSPSPVYGAWAPGEATGSYRLGGDVLLPGTDGGPAALSGADLGAVVVDELERPAHRRARFTAAS
ncbi:NAD(P)-dependent oxidoreductase [Luteimicrobium subarcticum]|uniref:NAD(P)-binding domain-containing protein n=1 Tax=Luteimicrobium subarcticum TaxID=620910 RepID=A0A2M8WUF2_9MICO|nr:NAD(P)H-binding protein [Luteimicrobium subarcticum]PJI94575.1 hypothetical protein CLV34_0419 [Luteimicrobium subarcticum]